MSRSPDTPCTLCGTLLWTSTRTSLPAGERICRPCRQARGIGTRGPGPGLLPKVCRHCGTSFTPERARRTMCSVECSVAALHAHSGCDENAAVC